MATRLIPSRPSLVYLEECILKYSNIENINVKLLKHLGFGNYQWTVTEDINNGFMLIFGANDQGASTTTNGTQIINMHYGTQGYPILYYIKDKKKGTTLSWTNTYYVTCAIIKIN